MKTKKALIIIVLVILVIPAIGFAVWQLKKGEPVDVFVVNKSMTSYNGSENKTFNYVLNRNKIFTTANRPYDLKVDHYGLQWNNGDYRVNFPRLKDLERTAERADLVYYADVSGITTSDIGTLEDGEENKLEYGGLNNADYTLVREVIRTGKPLIIETGFFGPADPLVRYNIEQLTDVYYVGWSGKYVRDLSDDADLFAGLHWKKLYSEYTGVEWSATGPGIVLINPEARRVLVLKEGEHIQTENGLIVSTDIAMDEYGLPPFVNFEGWFSLLHPGRNEVLSEFRLEPTEEGKQLLNEFGIPETFPALIHAGENVWFLAGDFGKCRSNILLPRVAVVGPVFETLKGKSAKASNFFYSYYEPFMTTMVDKAIEIRKADN